MMLGSQLEEEPRREKHPQQDQTGRGDRECAAGFCWVSTLSPEPQRSLLMAAGYLQQSVLGFYGVMCAARLPVIVRQQQKKLGTMNCSRNSLEKQHPVKTQHDVTLFRMKPANSDMLISSAGM